MASGTISDALADRLGMADATALVPPINPADALGGRVTADAAARTGVPEGTPVGVGMMDVAVTGVGLGAVDDGNGWLILGTTGFVGVLVPSIAERRSQHSMVLATGRGTQVLEFLAPMTGTPNLDWIRTRSGCPTRPGRISRPRPSRQGRAAAASCTCPTARREASAPPSRTPARRRPGSA